jgi:hypothetical protein
MVIPHRTGAVSRLGGTGLIPALVRRRNLGLRLGERRRRAQAGRDRRRGQQLLEHENPPLLFSCENLRTFAIAPAP